jgi:signal transduction histidine kinase
MCLPSLVENLEGAYAQLQQSHQELSEAQERLVHTEKLASMGQISAGVAHEINNPLGTILIYSHMLMRELQQNDPRREDFEMIATEATRCKNIVRGLLDFARQSRISKRPTDLKLVIEEVVTITTPKALENEVSVSCDVHDSMPIMMIDTDQVKQMLVNLVNNGIDAISSSPIAPALQPGSRAISDKVTIAAGLSQRGDKVELEIKDTGCGIPQENLSKLFTPFFTTKELGKGTGLGLAIAYGVVKMHSGEISVESEQGKGTTFHISFPIERVKP